MKLILVLVMLSLLAPGNCKAADNVDEVSKPLVTISGTDSKVAKPSYERISTSEKWAEAWLRHSGTTKDDFHRPLMEIDFDRCTVVAIFRGEKTQVRQLVIDSVLEKSKAIIIRFTELGYGIGGTGPQKPENRYPYAFIVLPKSNKDIVFVEGTEVKGRNPERRWKTGIQIDANGVRHDVGVFRRVLGPVEPDEED